MAKSKSDIGFFQELLPNGQIGNSFTRLQCFILLAVGIVLIAPVVWGNTTGVPTGLGLIGIATGQKLVQKYMENSSAPDGKSAKSTETNIT